MDTQDFLSFVSCRSSEVDDMEEVRSESSRKMQHKEETTPQHRGLLLQDGKKRWGGGWSQEGK